MGELTAEAIRSMPAGRAMDALVEERVFGRRVVDPWDDSPEGRSLAETFGPLSVEQGRDEVYVPYYSTDIAAAWRVMEHLAMTRRLHGVSWGEGGYKAQVASRPQTGSVILVRPVQSFHAAVAETAPLAICRAALVAFL